MDNLSIKGRARVESGRENPRKNCKGGYVAEEFGGAEILRDCTGFPEGKKGYGNGLFIPRKSTRRFKRRTYTIVFIKGKARGSGKKPRGYAVSLLGGGRNQAPTSAQPNSGGFRVPSQSRVKVRAGSRYERKKGKSRLPKLERGGVHPTAIWVQIHLGAGEEHIKWFNLCEDTRMTATIQRGGGL